MSFFGGSNPNMMNGAFYQAMIQQMQGGGNNAMPQMQNMSPNLTRQPRQQMSNVTQAPQIPQRQGQPGGGVGSAVQAGNNLQQLYGMGKTGYNNLSGMFGQNTPAPNANPNAMPGSPVANSPAGNSYLNQNPNMAQPPQNNGQPFFGNMGNTTSNMFGPQAANGMGQAGNAAEGSPMFGSMGSNGAADASGSAAGGSAATDSSPSWLQQLWDYL